MKSFFISCEAYVSASVIISHNIRVINQKIGDINMNDYTDVLDEIGIIINCHPVEYLELGCGKRREYISYKNRYADIRLPIDYDQLLKSDRETQYIMVVRNIIDSIEVIKKRLNKRKMEFDSDKLIQYILDSLGISNDDLLKIGV